jgi:hypothetical protein
MKKFEVRIPRLVRMTEWETMIVEAEDEEQAKENAIYYTNVIGNSEWEEEDHETIERYDDDIEINEIKEVV